MSRYAAYGSLDDRIDQAGDVGFVGFNNRLRPDQLQAGMLADAQNVRMDVNGQAQVRKGVDVVNAPISVGSGGLILPFPLLGTSVPSGQFTIGTEYQILEIGTVDFVAEQGASSNTVGVSFTAIAVGTADNNSRASTSDILSCSISEASVTTGTITVTPANNSTFPILGYIPSSNLGQGSINISGSSVYTPSANGIQIYKNFTSSFLSFLVQPQGFKFSGGPETGITVKFGVINDNLITDIFGSTGFSSPSNRSDQFMIFSSNTLAVGLDFSRVTSAGEKLLFKMAYPSGVTYNSSTELIQAYNKAFIFQGGKVALENELKVSQVSQFITQNIYPGDLRTLDITCTHPHFLVGGETITTTNIPANPEFLDGPYGPVQTGKLEMPQTLISAGALIVGEEYIVYDQGSSDFTLVGASSNVRDSIKFKATGTTSGTGTARKVIDQENSFYVPIPDIGTPQGGTIENYPDMTIATAFTKVRSGTYAQPTPVPLTNINYNGGIATATAGDSDISSLRRGDELTFVEASIATSSEQSLSIFVTNLAGGCNMSLYRTTASGTDSGTPIALTLGLNTFTAPAVNFDRSVFFRFTNSSVQFNNLNHNGTQLYSSSISKTIASSGFFTALTGTFAARIGVTPTGATGNSGTSTYTIGSTITISSIPSATTFTFPTDKPNSTGLTGTVIRGSSQGLGFVRMPAPRFATYHQRRLFMPYDFSVESTPNTYKTRNILDEVIASDLQDTDTYDQFESQYRFNAGTSDFLVGLHSFAEDRLLVFNRNSIHIIANTTDLKTSTTRVLTDEVGCVAPKTIKQVGNQVLFLSDNGVYGTQFLDEYNLRGTETPLSEPINSTISRINKVAQSQSVSCYFDNRYYIAVPLDNSSKNNALLIYNFLNKQWESIDTVDDPEYNIKNLFVLGEDQERGVYAVNDAGGIHRLDFRSQDGDLTISTVGGTSNRDDIKAQLTTRQYTLGTLDRKRWKEFDFHFQSSSSEQSDVIIDIETENPDSTSSAGKLSTFNGGVLLANEDVSIRGRIGNKRGYGIQFTLKNTEGRPIIRAIEVEGATTMRSTNKAI